MGKQSSKMKLLYLLPVLCVTAFWTVAGFPQNSTGTAAPPMPPRGSPAWLLIEEARVANTPEGAQQYAQHLTTIFVSARAGRAYVDEFSRRLALADLAARQGKRNWIPETAIAQTFNDMMMQVTPPPSKPLHTDVSVVHQMRLTLYAVSHDLSSVDSHSSECLPSEAVSVMIQLLLHNGSTEDPCPPTPDANGRLVQHACDENADVLVFSYSRSHSRSENMVLFDHVAQLFGI